MTSVQTKPADADCTLKESGNSPLDSLLIKAISEAGRDGRGFAVRMADEASEAGVKQLVYRVDQAPQLPVDEYEAPVDWRAHRVQDVQSLVALATKYSDAQRGLVLFTDGGAVLSLDETRERGKRELVHLKFVYSPEYLAWVNLTSRPLAHRELFESLLRFQHTLEDADILNAMRTVKVGWCVNTDSDVRVDGETFGVFYKSQADNTLVNFPRQFDIRIPILDKDVAEETAWVVQNVRLEIEMPKKPDEPVLFRLYAPKLAMAVRRRIDLELQVVRDGLPSWCIARGEHQQTARTVMRPD